MPSSQHAYLTNGIYRFIANRFKDRHNIDIGEHISAMQKIGDSLGEGITFHVVDSQKLVSLLDMPSFAHDNRENICEAVAASATHGEGYREVGAPSLHCQITKVNCNIHIDSYGFVAIGPDGKKYYNPDLIQHVIEELGWAKAVEYLKEYNPTAAKAFGRIRPIVPNSRNFYAPAIGLALDVGKGQRWNLGVEATVSINNEKKVMLQHNIWQW